MIIFDLDGTLADCEHRRHFVDPEKNPDYFFWTHKDLPDFKGAWYHKTEASKDYPEMLKHWKPDWRAFYDACDKDVPIEHTIEVLGSLAENCNTIEIWSGRCESVRDKTIEWLSKYLCLDRFSDGKLPKLKMRPIGDSIPDDELKERWLDENIEMINGKRHCTNKGCNHYKCSSPIECVFDDRPKVIRMWRRRGIFVFNCCQHDEEF